MTVGLDGDNSELAVELPPVRVGPQTRTAGGEVCGQSRSTLPPGRQRRSDRGLTDPAAVL